MIDRSSFLSPAGGSLTKKPDNLIQCACRSFRSRVGPDNGNVDTDSRSGKRKIRNGHRSGAGDFCECGHYPPEHDFDGRCSMMVWDASAYEPWDVDGRGRIVPARIIE